MNFFALALAFLALSTASCASSLKTFDASGKASSGIPVSSPVLVRITEKTSYVANTSNAELSKNCNEETNSRLDFLAIGERSYINFDAASLGKGEFKIEFNDSGVIKSVSLNSDATAGTEQIAGLLGTVLPFLAAPQATQDEPQIEGATSDDSAQELKDKYCLKSGTEILSVEKVNIS